MTKPRNNDVYRPPSTTPPNTTGVHLHQAPAEKLRTNGLHAINTAAKSYSRKSSAVAASTTPWRNSTTTRNYAGTELTRPPARTNIGHAAQLPSRIGAHLFHPCGRVTTLDGQTVSVSP